ncbi:MAG: alpha/beta fold hydrolase, partial [Stellaceae bacterium]
MRRPAFLAALVIALALAGGAQAKPQWLTLPPTPTLPKPETSGYAPVNGIRVWYEEFGRGAPVILLHGGLANVNYWGKQVPVLARHYRVIVMDSRGHGRSTRNAEPFGYDLMASDVLGLMDYLKIPKAAIVGWSDGAILGLDIALHHP